MPLGEMLSDQRSQLERKKASKIIGKSEQTDGYDTTGNQDK